MESVAYWNYEFLAFSMAAQTSGSRLGNTANDATLPAIYESTGNLAFGFWIGFGLAVICLATSVTFVVIEKCAQSRHEDSHPAVETEPPVKLSGIFKFPAAFWLLPFYVGFFYCSMNAFNGIASGMAQVRFGFTVRSAGNLIVGVFVGR